MANATVNCVRCGYSVDPASAACPECGLPALESRMPRGLARLLPSTIHLLWIGALAFGAGLVLAAASSALGVRIYFQHLKTFEEFRKLNSPISWEHSRGFVDDAMELTRDTSGFLILGASLVFAIPLLHLLRMNTAQHYWRVLDSRLMLWTVLFGIVVSSPTAVRVLVPVLGLDARNELSCLSLVLEAAVFTLAIGRATRLCLAASGGRAARPSTRWWISGVFVLTVLAVVIQYSDRVLFFALQSVDSGWFTDDLPWPFSARLGAPFIAYAGGAIIFVALLRRLAPIRRAIDLQYAASMSPLPS